MKLDPNCVRDVMLTAEEHLQRSYVGGTVRPSVLPFLSICNLLPEYKPEQIAYTIDKLIEGGLIDGTYFSSNNFMVQKITVKEITYTGHEFLEKIRNDGRWEKAKQVAAEIGDFSLSSLAEIAKQLAISVISKHFGLS